MAQGSRFHLVPNALWARLTLSATLVSIVLLLAATWLLSELFRTTVEKNFDADLVAVMDSVVAGLNPAPGGGVTYSGPQPAPRYAIPFSGYYWQLRSVTRPESTNLASSSLLEQRFSVDAGATVPRDAQGIAAFSLTDAQGTRLRAVTQRLRLFGSRQETALLVTGNFAALQDEIAAFRTSAMAVLGLLGAGLMLAIFIQVRFGLRPLRALQQRLAEIRNGTMQAMAENYPAEIQPIATELNLLVQANGELLNRARAQVGNLAHALKTPLTVLNNEAWQKDGPFAEAVTEQVSLMRNHIDLYLDRARRAAQATSIGTATEVAPVIAGLARTISKIFQDRKLTLDVNCPPGVRFRGERQDLEEMVGNLMDNAGKWAEKSIAVTVTEPVTGVDGRAFFSICVADDGPGLPEEARALVLKRGQRLDETKPGSGLGLSIVVDTAAMYGGTLELGLSEAGGLQAKLLLPALASQ